jgi:hypothetical protein
MANPAAKVTFDPKPILVGAAWALVATHALSGQREQVIGFHKGRPEIKMRYVRCRLIYIKAA